MMTCSQGQKVVRRSQSNLGSVNTDVGFRPEREVESIKAKNEFDSERQQIVAGDHVKQNVPNATPKRFP
jgi:translation elongation factor EF-1alpha